MKGIILAGGSGSRLFPVTLAVSKQLLPLYDKPMIYYPLSVLMLAKIQEILVISSPSALPCYELLLSDGSHLGVKISYAAQKKPEGLAQAFIIGESFIQKDPVCLILGDNLFYGHDLPRILQESATLQLGGQIFGYHVQDPERYGIVSFDEELAITNIEEKPKKPTSNWAVPGLYFYDSQVVKIAKSLKPSPRGELEITDINKTYLAKKQLSLKLFGRGFAWLDAGTFTDYQNASQFVETIQSRQGIKIACPEEIAYRNGWIDEKGLQRIASKYSNEYGRYLLNLSSLDF